MDFLLGKRYHKNKTEFKGRETLQIAKKLHVMSEHKKIN